MRSERSTLVGPAYALLTLLLLPASASAHDVEITSVARVFLDEIGERRYVLSIVDTQVPPVRDLGSVLPAGCARLPEAEADAYGRGGFAFECEEELTIDDTITLPWSLEGVVVLARWRDRSEVSAYFRGDGEKVEVHLGGLRASAGPWTRLSSSYFVLGVKHILLGIDHLLFVLGLLLLVRGFGPLVKTITAFTVAHSITLGAAVLGYVSVDSGPVEAAIALSIVLLAREIVMGTGHDHLIHRQPWLVAFVFGLLHGLGFAGALGEIGLRSADVPVALLFFNVGVEAGQLLFIAVLVALNQLLRGTVRDRIPQLQPALGYTLGGLSMLWFLERLPAVWGA